MKRATFLIVLLVCSLIPAVGWAEIKIGYINSEVVMERLPEMMDVRRTLEQLAQDYQNQAMDRQMKLQKLESDFEKQQLLMSEARKAELQAEYQEKVRQLQAFTQEKLGPEGELARKQVQLLEPILSKINDAVRTLANDEGYDMIIDSPGPGGMGYSLVVFAHEKYDLTETLLELLEKQRTEQGQ